MQLEELGLIGNCQISALISNRGEILWSCMPRFDSGPVFSKLLDEPEGGHFSIGDPSGMNGVQSYLNNTNILTTTFCSDKSSFRVIDFAPRFNQFGRMFRPTQIVRIIEPLHGLPMVSVECDPTIGWSKKSPTAVFGSNHIRYDGFESHLRLTTDIPLSYTDGRAFALSSRKYFILSWGAPVEEPLPMLCERFLIETQKHWQDWVKHCNVPPSFQKEVIRSALALRLHCFDDTGAIIASATTSIPESPGSGRTWDYRYCWLRDAYYVLGAFRLLGLFEERENFTNFLLNIAANSNNLDLSPLYRIDGRSDLQEEILTNWVGYKGEKPIRVGNGASLQRQNDIYGEMVLALTPIFLDERYTLERTNESFELIQALTKKAIEVAGTPDSGIWEYRLGNQEVQTFSSLMSWAAADRMSNICSNQICLNTDYFQKSAKLLKEQIIEKAWNDSLGSFSGTYNGNSLDASLLQMPILRFLDRNDSRLINTIQSIKNLLSRNGLLHRYNLNDGFGHPEVAFTICTFWLIEALAVMGQKQEAFELMKEVVARMTPLGLLSEDFDTSTNKMWGNFPQTYSHVGLIHAAFASSARWSEVL